MKTQIIQRDPHEPAGPGAGATPPPKRRRNLAASVGGWSARHWKTAVVGWLVFVVASLFLSIQVGTKFIDQNDANVGESRTADRIIHDAGFTVDEKGETIEELGEMVLVQSDTHKPTDAAFRAVVEDVENTLGTFPAATKVRSPYDAGHADLISKDGRSAMVTYSPKGTYEEAILYIDDHRRGHRQGRGSPRGLHRRVGRHVDGEGDRRGDQGRSGEGRPDLDPADDHHPDVRARVARRGLDPAAARRHLGDGRHGPDRDLQPVHRSQREHHGGRPARRSRRRRRLRALLHAS